MAGFAIKKCNSGETGYTFIFGKLILKKLHSQMWYTPVHPWAW
jgi:hypothetical protein